MKPVLISSAILGVTIALLLLSATHLRQLVKPLEEKLSLAEQFACEEDWQSAMRLTQEVHDSFENESLLLHVILPHAELDQIYLLMAEAVAFLEEEKLGEYRASNQALLHRLSLLYGMESLTLQNLF